MHNKVKAKIFTRDPKLTNGLILIHMGFLLTYVSKLDERALVSNSYGHLMNSALHLAHTLCFLHNC